MTIQGGKKRKSFGKAVNKITKHGKRFTTRKQRRVIGDAGAQYIASRLAGMGRTVVVVPGKKKIKSAAKKTRNAARKARPVARKVGHYAMRANYG